MSSSTAWDVWWALGVVILALLLAVALVGNVIELAGFLLIGVAMAAVLAERTVGDSLSPHPEAAERIVALGDSYIAGEGANRFFPGTNVADENQYRRSSTAYPYLVARELGMDLDFLACSGARPTIRYTMSTAAPLTSPLFSWLRAMLASASG